MTTRDILRKRVAPAVALIGIAFLVQHTCLSSQRHHATVILDLGADAATARSVTAEVRAPNAPADDEPLGLFHRTALEGSTVCPCKFEVALPDDTAELAIDIALPSTTKHVKRTLHVIDDGGTIQVKL